MAKTRTIEVREAVGGWILRGVASQDFRGDKSYTEEVLASEDSREDLGNAVCVILADIAAQEESNA